MVDNEGNEGQGTGQQGDTGTGEGQTTTQQQGGENFVAKDRYDELLRQKEALEATQRTILEDQQQQAAATRAATQAPSADDYVREYARQQGISVEEAQQWINSTNPIVEARLNSVIQQVTPILGGMADRIAVMELEAHPDYGDLYKEHKKEITRMRNDATKKGEYLAPEAALNIVVAKSVLSKRKKGGDVEVEPGEDNSEVSARAKSASLANVKGVRASSPKGGPVNAADVAKMSPEDRIKFFEESDSTI
ncbi:MAG: hypothetical protein ACXADF_16340 [Candidatus Thorarchaeota archaeon]|jgi:hypothetical protein